MNGLPYLQADVWEKISTTTIKEWHGCQLVGVEGSTIKLLGTVSVTITRAITLAGLSVGADILVAEALNTEAILGLDVLEQYGCTINAQHCVLHVQGKAITLQGNGN